MVGIPRYDDEDFPAPLYARRVVGTAASPTYPELRALAVSTGATALYDVTDPDTRSPPGVGNGGSLAGVADSLETLPDLAQGTGSLQPQLSVGAFGQIDGVLGAGGEWLKTTAFAAELAQPNFIIVVARKDDSITGSDAMILDGIASGKRHTIYHDGVNNKRAVFANVVLRDGATDADAHIYGFLADGTSNGRLYVDSALAAIGDAGPQDLSGLTLLARWEAADARPWTGPAGAVIVYDTPPSDADRTAIFDKLHEMTAIPKRTVLSVSELARSADLGMDTYMQGVEFDGTHYYTASNDTLYKWTRDEGTGAYSLVTSAARGAVPAEVTQINSLHVYNGSLWVGANNFSNTPKKAWLLKYDLSDLSLSDSYLMPVAEWGEGGVWKDIGSGDEFWAVFHSWPRAARLTLSGGVLSKVADYDLGLAGTETNLYQGARWLGDTYFLANRHNEHNHTTLDISEWTGSGFVGRQRVLPLRAGAGQGIAWETEGSVLLFAERVAGGSTDQRIIRATVDLA